MTDEQLYEYYAKLLILQYIKLPKAYATVYASVIPFIMNQMPKAVNDAFNIETAVGQQLDWIGKYVGVSRLNYTGSGQVSLTDDDYRTLIKMIIIKNNSGSSLGTIQSLLQANFGNAVSVTDNQAMGLSYTIVNTFGSEDFLAVLVYNDYLPRPMAVETSVVIVPVFEYPLFGFRTYSAPDNTVSPFNTYGFYQTTYPWLSYEDI